MSTRQFFLPYSIHLDCSRFIGEESKQEHLASEYNRDTQRDFCQRKRNMMSENMREL